MAVKERPMSGLREAAVVGLLGLALVAISTALHPTITALSASEKGLTAVAFDRTWVLDHLLFAIGLLLLILGLTPFRHVLHRHHMLLDIGTIAWVSSLPVWLVTLAIELAFVPKLAKACRLSIAGTGAVERHLQAVMAGGWAVPLLAGYFATLLMWLAVALWGLALWSLGCQPRWVVLWGVVGGLLGCAGLPVGALVDAPWAAWVTGGTSALAGAWLLAAAHFMWHGVRCSQQAGGQAR